MADSQQITVQVELLPADFRAFTQYVLWHRFRASHLRTLFIVPALFLTVVATMAAIGHRPFTSILALGAYTAALVVLWLFWGLSLPHQHAKTLEKQADRRSTTMTFSSSGLEEEGPGFRRHLDWGFFSHIVQFRQLLLLVYTSDPSMIRAEMIPCRALGSSEACQAFQQHLAGLLSASRSGC